MNNTEIPQEGNKEGLLKEKIAELELLIEEGRLINTKLATCLKIFVGAHITKREKIKIANDINNANSEGEVNKIYEFYKNSFSLEESLTNEEYNFSDGFISNISKYYKSFRGYNPLEEIENLMLPMEQVLFLESQLNSSNLDESRKMYLQDTLQIAKENMAASIDEVKKITAENK